MTAQETVDALKKTGLAQCDINDILSLICKEFFLVTSKSGDKYYTNIRRKKNGQEDCN